MLLKSRPDGVPYVLAMDYARGWILMVDAGHRLKDMLRGDCGRKYWQQLLPLYAGVQRDLSSQREDQSTRGVPGCHVLRLAARYRELLEDNTFLGIDASRGMSAEAEFQEGTPVMGTSSVL